MRVISVFGYANNLQKKTWTLLLLVSLIFASFITYANASTHDSTFYQLINHRRAERGLNLLVLSSTLNYAAQQQADYIALSGEFSHLGHDGSTVQERTRNAGYGSYPNGMLVAESWGTGHVDHAFRALLDQSSDQNNIFSNTWREIGIGSALTESGLEVWVIVFGAQPGILPILINHNQEVTYERVVTVRLHNETIIQNGSSFGPVVEIRIAEQGFLSEAAWQAWQPEVQLELSPEDGTKWVKAQLRDEQGRLAEAWDTIYLDQTKSLVESGTKMEIVIETIPASEATSPAIIETTPTEVIVTPIPIDSTPVEAVVTPIPIDSTPTAIEITPTPIDSTLAEDITNSAYTDSTYDESVVNQANTATPRISSKSLTSLDDLNVAILWLTITPSTLQGRLPISTPSSTPISSSETTVSNEFEDSEIESESNYDQATVESTVVINQNIAPTSSAETTVSSKLENSEIESESNDDQATVNSTVVINQNITPSPIPTLILTSVPTFVSSLALNTQPTSESLATSELATSVSLDVTVVPPIFITVPPTMESTTTPLLYVPATVTEFPLLSSPTQEVTPSSLPMIEVTNTKDNQPALATTTPKVTKATFKASPTVSSFVRVQTPTVTPVMLASSLSNSSLSSPPLLSSDSTESEIAPESSSLFSGTIKRAVRFVTLLIIEVILLFAIGRLLFLGGVMGRR